jgi:hypothetical protein
MKFNWRTINFRSWKTYLWLAALLLPEIIIGGIIYLVSLLRKYF